jgi:FKBP-type peptidyl-prolyl cis-trans isomerase FkpA
MKRRLMFFALAAIGLASCNGGFKKGDGGMLYNIVDDQSGPIVKPGDYIAFNYTIKNDADSVLASSYESGHPVLQPMAPSQAKGDVMSGIAMLSEGDSAIIKVNIDTMSKGRPRQPGLKGKYIVYVIKVNKIIAKGNLDPKVFQGRVEAYQKSLSDVAQKAEPAKIKKYIADNNLKVTTTASGLNYVITTPGSGPNIAVGDTAVVNYTGRFTNGKIFETSVKAEAIKGKMQINPMNPYKPIRFPVGVQGMIQGWNEAFILFNKGTKATLVIPSSLAYGDKDNGMMAAYTPLVFDVELVDIIHPNPNAPKPVAPGPPQVQAQPVTK